MTYPYTYPSTDGNYGTGLYDNRDPMQPQTTVSYMPNWEPLPCSCGFAGMHTWLGHWFRLLWTRRTW